MMTLAAYLAAEIASVVAWVAQDPQNRFATTPVADVSFWNDMGIFTVEQYVRYNAEAEYSDAHKSAFGVRASADPSWTIEELQQAVSELNEIAIANYSFFKEQEASYMTDIEAAAAADEAAAAEAEAEAEWQEYEYHYNRLAS